MIFLLDNAPYHHKQDIPSLTRLTKAKLVELADEIMSGHSNQDLLLSLSKEIDKKRYEFLRTNKNRELIVASRGA